MSLRTLDRSSLTASRLEKLFGLVFESYPLLQLTLESMSGTRPVGVNGLPLFVMSDGLCRAVIRRLPGDSREEVKEVKFSEGDSIAVLKRSGTGGEEDFLWLQLVNKWRLV